MSACGIVSSGKSIKLSSKYKISISSGLGPQCSVLTLPAIFSRFLQKVRSFDGERSVLTSIARFKNLEAEKDRARTEKSFFVPKAEIVANDYDLSINKYKKVEYVAVEYPSTLEIMTDIREIEMKIADEMDALEKLLGL